MNRSLILCAPCIGLILLSSGCLTSSSHRISSPNPALTPKASGSSVLARLNNQPITEEDIQRVAGAGLIRAQVQLYDVREGAIRQIVEERLIEAEALREDLSIGQWIKEQISDNIRIEEGALSAYYEEHKAEFQDRPFEDVQEEVRARLFDVEYQKRYADLINRLKKRAAIEVLIEAPRVDVDDGGAPFRGPQNAPVTIIEFGDFQCPFCGRARPTINQILESYPKQVRYVFRDFPLPFHEQALKAHEACHCAGDQGRYWEMNQKLFENQQALTSEDFTRYAEELGLDIALFQKCLDAGEHVNMIQRHRLSGESAGVSGTPTFFVNGRMVLGMAPFTHFQQIIEQELAREKP